MSLLQAVVLGLVQGLTEFLPVSSSGHLVLVPALLGWPIPPLAFDVLLHASSLLAVLVYFRREIVEVIAGVFRPGPGRRFIWLLVVASLPAAVVGVTLEEPLGRVFGEPEPVALLLLGTGAILLTAETLARRRPSPEADRPGIDELSERVTLGRAAAIGLAQAVAILPGISRSGSTIATGMVTGLSRPVAARFSFLLAAPILAGTAVYQLPDMARAQVDGGALVGGFAAGLVSSYVAVWGMIAYLHRRGLYPFAAYCIIAGVAASLLFP